MTADVIPFESLERVRLIQAIVKLDAQANAAELREHSTDFLRLLLEAAQMPDDDEVNTPEARARLIMQITHDCSEPELLGQLFRFSVPTLRVIAETARARRKDRHGCK